MEALSGDVEALAADVAVQGMLGNSWLFTTGRKQSLSSKKGLLRWPLER